MSDMNQFEESYGEESDFYGSEDEGDMALLMDGKESYSSETDTRGGKRRSRSRGARDQGLNKNEKDKKKKKDDEKNGKTSILRSRNKHARHQKDKRSKLQICLDYLESCKDAINQAKENYDSQKMSLKNYKRKSTHAVQKADQQRYKEYSHGQKKEVLKSAGQLLDSFQDLFREIENLDKVDPDITAEPDLEQPFSIGSEVVDFDDINEQTKATFLVSLVKHFNIMKERKTKKEQRDIDLARQNREKEILKQQQDQVEKFLSVQKHLNSSTKKRQTGPGIPGVSVGTVVSGGRSNSSSPGVKYQYHRKENRYILPDISKFDAVP